MPPRRRSVPLLIVIALATLLLLPTFASAAAELEASPASLSFPATGIHDPAQNLSTELVNQGDEEAALTGISVAAPFSINFGASDCDDFTGLGPTGKCSLVVAFAPQSVGSFESSVTIEYGDAGGGHTLSINATGNGVAGTLEAGPLNFNTQP